MIYVDEVTTYPESMIKGQEKRWRRDWCHLFSDEEDKTELHEIARRWRR